MPGFEIRALDESTWEAFADLAANSGGWPSGCWCMAFHEEGAEKNSAALNRERKMGRVMSGTAHAALVFEDGNCVGWCQFGSPEELPRIKSRAAYEQSAGDPPDWRIGCCYVAKGHRRRTGSRNRW